jgi:alpha-1,2-mannosyltransferase
MVPLVVAAIALTPLATLSADLAQTSPILFVVAVLPLVAPVNALRQVAMGVAVGVAAALKIFPALLLVPLLAARRRREVTAAAAALAVLVAAASIIAGVGIWRDFLDSASAIADEARHNRFSGSIDSALDQVGITTGAAAISLVVRLATVLVTVVVWRSNRSFAARWAVVTAGLLLVFPQVWNHYAFMAFGALAVAVSTAADERAVWLLPAAAVAIAPIAIQSGGTSRVAAPLFAVYIAVFAATTATVALRRPAMVATA